MAAYIFWFVFVVRITVRSTRRQLSVDLRRHQRRHPPRHVGTSELPGRSESSNTRGRDHTAPRLLVRTAAAAASAGCHHRSRSVRRNRAAARAAPRYRCRDLPGSTEQGTQVRGTGTRVRCSSRTRGYGTRIAVKMDSTQTGQVHACMISPK